MKAKKEWKWWRTRTTQQRVAIKYRKRISEIPNIDEAAGKYPPKRRNDDGIPGNSGPGDQASEVVHGSRSGAVRNHDAGAGYMNTLVPELHFDLFVVLKDSIWNKSINEVIPGQYLHFRKLFWQEVSNRMDKSKQQLNKWKEDDNKNVKLKRTMIVISMKGVFSVRKHLRLL